MDLLLLQFNRGCFTESNARSLLRDNPNLWDYLKIKFEQDENGMYFNVKLKTEKEKREKYTQSRRESRSKSDEDNVRVYIVRDNVRNLHKIGSSVNPMRRYNELNFQQNPAIIGDERENRDLTLVWYSDPVLRSKEKELHDYFGESRKFGEWFNLSESDLNYIFSQTTGTYVERTSIRTENEDVNENRNITEVTSIEKVSKKKSVEHSEESSEVMEWFISSFDTVAFDWNDAAMNRARQGIDRSIKRLQNKPENKGLTKDESINLLKAIIKFVKDDPFWTTQFETPAKLMTNDKNGLNWLDRFINLYRQKSPELAKQRRDAETDRLIRNDEAQRERKKHEASQF